MTRLPASTPVLDSLIFSTTSSGRSLAELAGSCTSALPDERSMTLPQNQASETSFRPSLATSASCALTSSFCRAWYSSSFLAFFEFEGFCSFFSTAATADLFLALVSRTAALTAAGTASPLIRANSMASSASLDKCFLAPRTFSGSNFLPSWTMTRISLFPPVGICKRVPGIFSCLPLVWVTSSTGVRPFFSCDARSSMT
mmetsp:Transcript_79710/g.143872  ORF Transcript_79710/g.143872 Transcript_79710/m.143872 type:complete len:200 (+) Transcript_79710:2-601(+)